MHQPGSGLHLFTIHSQFKVPIEEEARQQLLKEYQALPQFQDAMKGLARAKQSGFKLFAFSNEPAFCHLPRLPSHPSRENPLWEASRSRR
jgi:FMN phosphatase YigB (HAD superfamily)